ncbi:MAG: 1,4-beta-xylanase [Candidatus Marinimicrobia bacterium]|nr:1,4-beta-xylanase [Candidatus Neomarinimicrobiota bacterium]
MPRFIIAFIALFIFQSCNTQHSGPEADTLKMRAQKSGIHIGAAVAANPLSQDERYAKTLAREFSLVTTENALKFGPVHPAPDRYDFEDSDAIIDFALNNDMAIRGHTLIWHNQQPAWLTDREWQRNELLAELENHIDTVVGRYKGKIFAWDVVNESVTGDGSYRETFWYENIGEEYISEAFRMAHEADPNALLFYNDYGAEGMNTKSDAVYNLVKSLVDQDVPIHGVGLQMHISVENYPDPDSVAKNIKRLTDLGLQVHITEMDVRIPSGGNSQLLQTQGHIYKEMMEVCLANQNCTAFVLWGFTDLYSWIPNFFDGYGSALIFDEEYQPKPGYDSLAAALE